MPEQEHRAGIYGPLGITVLALIAYRLGSSLPLPGIDLQYVGRFEAEKVISSLLLERFSIFALGILPWFSALTVIELIVVLLPKSWTQRFAPSGHAEPFSRSVIALALLIAALQGFGVTEAMMQQPKLVSSPGPGFQFPAVAALVAGLACIIGLARVIERQGLGHGFWIMLAASILAQLPSHIGVMLLMLKEGMASPVATIAVIASTVALVGLIVGILESRRRENMPGVEVFFWPLVLASLASALIVDIAVLILPVGSDDQVNALAKMLTNEPAGFVIGGVIASVLAASIREPGERLDSSFCPPLQ